MAKRARLGSENLLCLSPCLWMEICSCRPWWEFSRFCYLQATSWTPWKLIHLWPFFRRFFFGAESTFLPSSSESLPPVYKHNLAILLKYISMIKLCLYLSQLKFLDPLTVVEIWQTEKRVKNLKIVKPKIRKYLFQFALLNS